VIEELMQMEVGLVTLMYKFFKQGKHLMASISLFACWFQPWLISHDTVFSFHNKPASVGLISPETNQRTGCPN